MTRFSIIFLLIFILPFTINVTASETSEDDDHEPTQTINGQTVIFLDEEVQESSGIKTTQLQKIKFQPEFITYGKAISITPLLTILNQYLSASAKQVGAKARFNQAEKNISRLRGLHKDEAISTRKLQTQQSQWQSDKAIYNEMINQSKIIIANSNLQWGKKLTQWVTGKHSPQFDKLIHGESTLLQVTLPIGSSIPATIDTVFISPTGDRDKAFKASFVSLQPQVDKVSQGLQYLFLTDNPLIKTGMNFTAWVPQQKQNQQGVIIPNSSLTWHLGQAFVFIKIDEHHFTHRNITAPIKVPNGYFITDDIKDGEEIVVTGSQMLLSHEFRSQIPNEDDD
jgi:hypothetical protein